MEYLNVYDDNLSQLNKKVKRGEQLPPNEHILITIIYIENNNHEFLIQKTSPEKSGLYSSTGGHVQYKENSKQTIIREVFEELGVDISKDNIKYIKNISLGIPLCDIYYLKKDIDLSKLKLQSSEVSSVSFLKRETIEELIKNNTFHKTHAKVFNEVISYIDNIDILKKANIQIKEINSANNSYNSNVYIVIDTNNKKYILKYYNKHSKMLNEEKYLKYLSSYIPVSNCLSSGINNNKSYLIQSFVSGNCFYDEEANNLSNKKLINMGKLLAKLHSIKVLDKNELSWIYHLNNTLEKVSPYLENIFNNDNQKIYNYFKKYINDNIKNNYKISIIHADARVGNIIFDKDNPSIIDLESMKTGESIFDLVKFKRILNKDNFEIFLSGYESVLPLPNYYQERLDFYSIFDSYSSLYWCITHNKKETEFYKLNYNIVKSFLKGDSK